ncbi:MAG: hypothetical protein JRN50_02320 [Nitrososphaerota archaeon]|nr:hypothetical protein [Nitrososphaerota archaeon]
MINSDEHMTVATIEKSGSIARFMLDADVVIARRKALKGAERCDEIDSRFAELLKAQEERER